MNDMANPWCLQNLSPRVIYYKKYGLAFIMAVDVDMLIQIQIIEGFGGKLNSGISLSSGRDEVFRTYGSPLSEQPVEDFSLPEIDERKLYRRGNDSIIEYSSRGVRFHFAGDRIREIVIVRKNGASAVQQTSFVVRRTNDTEEARKEMERLRIAFTDDEFLMWATQSNPAVVELFLVAGIKPDVRDSHRRTALMRAASGNNSETVRILLERGARVNARDDRRPSGVIQKRSRSCWKMEQESTRGMGSDRQPYTSPRITDIRRPHSCC
ncbi:MAG: ankyrin repeat domain-containing protein [Candidatus Lindowbacteria bacterium]|nr:ankyrin repeat domain-containing protein [Candidatus Lindowbacteria bacterium]